MITAGCQSGEYAGGGAKGIVHFNGQPLTEGVVVFQPVDVGSTGYGKINSNGSFEMKTGVSMNGIKPGDYEVAIECWQIFPDSVDEKGNVVVNGLSKIPRKYTNPKTSGFKASVKPDVVNEFTFEMTGEAEKVSPKEEPQK
jgi:formylmethanofuran dehydrogenase subunit C